MLATSKLLVSLNNCNAVSCSCACALSGQPCFSSGPKLHPIPAWVKRLKDIELPFLTQAAPAMSKAASSLSFADNAPTWEELQRVVEEKQQALGAVPPDPVTVRHCHHINTYIQLCY